MQTVGRRHIAVGVVSEILMVFDTYKQPDCGSKLWKHLPSVDAAALCPARGLGWQWATKQLPGKHITCHACLHASSGCPGAISPPCEAVAKLRLGKSFSVAKLVTCEVGKVRYRSQSSGCPQTQINTRITSDFSHFLLHSPQY